MENFEYRWPHGFADSRKNELNLTVSNQKFEFISTHILGIQYGGSLPPVRLKDSLLVIYGIQANIPGCMYGTV